MYIKKNEELLDGMRQMFEHFPVTHGSVSENVVIKMYNNGLITQDDLNIIDFLFDLRMATEDQLCRMFNELDKDYIHKRLENMIGNHILNRFMYCDEMENKIKDDAEFVYTLDFGAIGLLRHLLDNETVDTWKGSSLIENTTKVNKELMTTEFYIQLKKKLGERLYFFHTLPVLYSKGVGVIPKAMIAVDGGDDIKYYILECVREYDTFSGGHTRVAEKIFRLGERYKDRAYEKLIPSEPTLIILGDNFDTVRYTSDCVVDSFIPECRYCTLESIKDLDKGFYKLTDEGFANIRIKALS